MSHTIPCPCRDGYRICPECNGHGDTPRYLYGYPWPYNRCWTCKGEGWLPCRECGGSAELVVDEDGFLVED